MYDFNMVAFAIVSGSYLLFVPTSFPVHTSGGRPSSFRISFFIQEPPD